MRAALVETIGEPPVPGEWGDPERGEGQALVDVRAAPINPIDVATASGRFYGGTPDAPYVPGVEGLGVVSEGERFGPGTRVYLSTSEASNGSFATRVAVPEEALIEVPDGADDPLAAALGVAGLAAWVPLAVKAEVGAGDRVLVLGASGAVGTIGVQVAKALGAERVVAAARDAEALERLRDLGADATVRIGDHGDLAAAFQEAAGGPVDVTLDPVWGEPATAAIAAAAAGGCLVNIGQSAGAEATFPSAAVRSKELRILGHTNMALAPANKAEAYRTLVGHAAAGRIRLEIETFGWDGVTNAWRRQAEFPRGKLVLVPDGA